MEKTKQIMLEDMRLVPLIFGEMDRYLSLVERELKIKVAVRDGYLSIMGSQVAVDEAELAIVQLLRIVEKGGELDEQTLRYMLENSAHAIRQANRDMPHDALWVTPRGRLIKAKTHGQAEFVAAVKKHDVVFGIGPAGTGKTFLAVTMAIKAFKEKQVERIVITRPAVEAGESLGFLPGDLQQKIDPYLRPLYDAMYEILGMESYLKYKERGLIEVVPLAYMRGRTLDNAFIILDEAQNTTPAQMKMFLTRFGFGSKVIVNGDLTQIDLGIDAKSGLVEAKHVLKDIEGIAFHYFTHRDVVRHELVKRIIKAYDALGGDDATID